MIKRSSFDHTQGLIRTSVNKGSKIILKLSVFGKSKTSIPCTGMAVISKERHWSVRKDTEKSYTIDDKEQKLVILIC